MAQLTPIQLSIRKIPNSLAVIPEVTYEVIYDDSDRATNRTYEERVDLVGVDDGFLNRRDEVILFGTAPFGDGALRANGRSSEPRTHTRNAQLRELNEDRPGRDEIRAVVTLTSGSTKVTRSSNLVTGDFNPAHA
jgi:hypothetical protein